MNAGRRAGAGTLALAGTLMVIAIGCRDDKHVAELVETGARVERDLAGAQGQWKPAAVADRFSMGDGLRTGALSFALLKVGKGARMKVEAETLIRFSASAPGAEKDEQNIAVDMGQVTLETGAEPVSLRSGIGVAVIAPGTQLRIGKAEKISRYEVLIGSANVKTENGAAIELTPGHRIEVNIDTAKIDRIDTGKGGVPAAATGTPPDAAPVPVPAAAAAAAGTAPLELDVLVRASRFREGAGSAWRTLAPGHHQVSAAGSLEIPAKGRVKISRGDESALLQGRGSFVVGDAAALVRAELGQVSVTNAAGDVTVRVPGGSIVIKRGEHDRNTSAEVNVGRDATTEVRVQKGLASVVTGRASNDIRDGERLNLGRDGHVTILGAGGGRADVTVPAGESFVVHDPRPPTAVGVDVSRICREGGGRVKLAGGRTFEADAAAGAVATATLPSGRHRYDVSCRHGDSWTRTMASGTVQVIRDTGVSELPRSAPASFIDTDGRKYTVLYQNLLPAILVRWPDAPKAASYVLTVRSGSGGKQQSFKTKTARHQLASGRLAEGIHTVQFGTVGSPSVLSPETTINIGFDNAAPTAVVKTPKDRAFSPGQAVAVSGIALPGWRVSALGAPLTLDDHNRFSGEVRPGPDAPAIAVRFEHGDRGVHYYVRRAQRSPR